MRPKLVIFLYPALLASVAALADNRCDPATAASINHTQFLVDSIRVDKPGLARVYAADGSEFTAGQALWMKGQMREIQQACASSDQTSAAQRLAAIQALITAHSR